MGVAENAGAGEIVIPSAMFQRQRAVFRQTMLEMRFTFFWVMTPYVLVYSYLRSQNYAQDERNSPLNVGNYILICTASYSSWFASSSLTLNVHIKYGIPYTNCSVYIRRAVTATSPSLVYCVLSKRMLQAQVTTLLNTKTYREK
jgi:hypothetical protein